MGQGLRRGVEEGDESVVDFGIVVGSKHPK